ncbi:MAG: histidine kinase [Bryobacterales bacterium]|nr:histidine kinase [Bryobacterales bacterium]
MHPFFKNKAQLLIYLALWVPVSSVFALLLVNGVPPWPLEEALWFSALIAVVMAFLFLSLYNVCRSYPLGETAPARLLLTQLIAVSVSAMVWLFLTFVAAAAVDRFAGVHFHMETIQRALLPLLIFAYVVFALGVAVGYLLLALETQRSAELQQQQMKMLAWEAELRSLRSQINPHFLFNSLNSISALTTLNPGQAREMCLLLADFFRKNIDIGHQDSTTLGEELDLVFNYLQIEMARFGKRLQVDSDVPDSLRHFSIQPLLLQPLVENAVKHGIAGLIEGGTISIRAKPLADGGISLSVENPYDPDQPVRPRRGTGLENLRSRLDYRYGPDARLEVQREENRFRAKIQIASTAGSPLAPVPPTFAKESMPQ